MTERKQLEQTIVVLDAQRGILGDVVADTAITALREKLVALRKAGMVEHRKQVTVLFADLVGFTAIAAEMDPEDVQDVMDAYFGRWSAAIERHGGVVEKFIGDAVMAVFGLCSARESDPANAVRAALAMQRSLGKLNGELEHKVRLAMRVGINTGLALIGFLGHEDEDFKVVGDVVNMAAHLQDTAPVDGILISQPTHERVRGLFDVQALPPMTIKGRPEPAQTYLILSEKPRVFYMPTPGLAGATTRTIGRDAELVVLQTAYQQAYAGAGLQWVTISGEAGVGKSRLLAEFEHWVELRPESVWHLRARAWPQTQHSPYFLLRDLLSLRFQISESDPLTVARDKLTAGFSEVLGDELGEETAAFVGQLLGFDFGHSRWIAHIRDDTRQIRGRAEVLLREWLNRPYIKRPAALLLEDLQWADEESLALLSDILSKPPQISDGRADAPSGDEQPWRLCVIGLMRPEFWERGVRWGLTEIGESVARHYYLDLKPFSDKGVQEELVRELLQRVDQPPEWMVELLIERGAGNPYFTEELVHWLIEQGVITVGPDTQSAWWVHQQPLLGLSVPGTVQGVLQARLERLSQNERAVLQRAAVLGRIFWDGGVACIGQEAVPVERWYELQQRDLVLWHPTSQLPGEEYHFKHVLLRDVVYDYTLKKMRRVFHRRAAEWLIQVTAERAAEWAAVIATHYEQAGETEPAARWYGQAGKQAQATYAPEAAITYYQKALALLPEEAEETYSAQRIALYEGLGEMLRWQARYTEAAESYTAMRLLTEAAGDLVAQVRAWIGVSWTRDSQGDFAASLESASKAEEIAQAAGDPAKKELAKAKVDKGWGFLRLGDAEAALDLGQQALTISSELGARREMADSLNLLYGVHHLLGRYDQAARHNERAVELYRELGHRSRLAAMLSNLGEIARLRGEYRTAVIYYQKALAIARQIGDRDGERIVLSNLGGARVGLGEYRAAEDDLRRVVRLIETAGQGGDLSETYCFLAEACLGQGKLKDALAMARQALALGQEMGGPELIGVAWRTLGTVAAQRSESTATEGGRPGSPLQGDVADCFAKSLDIFARTGMEGERARTLRAWAKYEMERGDRDKGKVMWQKARKIFKRLGMELEIERMAQVP